VGVARACELENRRDELERARFDGLGGRLELHQESGDVDASMRRGVGREPAARLLELALATDSLAPPGLVPSDGDVHEALKEVALGRLGRAPGVFQLLMGSEELTGPNQLQAALERIVRWRP
jgi:hypothetical protein